MQTNLNSVWTVRIATFAVFALAGASAAYWGLKVWGASQSGRSSLAAIAGAQPIDPQAVAQVLGGGAAALRTAELTPSAASTQYVLIGVVADTAHGGAALIAVDGKPAKPFSVGATVDGRLVLQSVTGRRAVLGSAMDGPAEVALELPPLEK